MSDNILRSLRTKSKGQGPAAKKVHAWIFNIRTQMVRLSNIFVSLSFVPNISEYIKFIAPALPKNIHIDHL